ncbi:MAG: ATP-dependent DNA helicase, partial [Bacteroidota bacterium]
PSVDKPNANQLRKLRKLKPQLGIPLGNTPTIDPNLSEGTLVNHTRFGKGKILKIEGAGNDKKAEIQFEKGNVKKLLLRFAKLEIVS